MGRYTLQVTPRHEQTETFRPGVAANSYTCYDITPGEKLASP